MLVNKNNVFKFIFIFMRFFVEVNDFIFCPPDFGAITIDMLCGWGDENQQPLNVITFVGTFAMSKYMRTGVKT